MNRKDWSAGRKEEPVMSWGEIGNDVTNKQTGEEWSLHTKFQDGWGLKRGGSILWVSFQDLAKDYTEPKGYSYND